MRKLISRLIPANARGPAGFVLMYHRIGRPVTDPWELSVSPDLFRQQLKHIRQNFEVLPLDQLCKKKINHRTQVALSFDDGYADNYLIAKPLLEEFSIPASFFITTAMPDSKEVFWWDELARIFLETPHLPRKGYFSIGQESISVDLGDASDLDETETGRIRSWKAGITSDHPRASAFMRIWKVLRQTRTASIKSGIASIREWAGLSEERPSCMSWDMIISLSQNPLFTIGAHTENHPMLTTLDQAAQESEILMSKTRIEEKIGKPVTMFAAPYGAYDQHTLKTLVKLGFQLAFTTEPGMIKPQNLRRKPLELGRYQIMDHTNLEDKSFTRS